MSEEEDFLKELFRFVKGYFVKKDRDTSQGKLPSSNSEDKGGGEGSPPPTKYVIRDPDSPATLPQKKKLRYLGFKGDLESLTKGEASEKIKELDGDN